ncbi:hypothetical protein ACE1ET_17160 [Saccharicrinis sp. FJH62]|uniref:hypothetical protein n=1 Tax=Saccharicrinis sp. FJH62 TaxID=3344657 RepID=UPI0035D46E89
MRKFYTVITGLLLTTLLWAQSPEKMSYQAVVRNSASQLLSNSSIGIQISIIQGSISGTTVYIERHFPTTNENGLVSLEIGTGTVISGSFTDINWSTGPYFIKSETDLNGGANYTIEGINQILSVPYALYAKTAETFNEVDPVFNAWDKSYNDLTEKPDIGAQIESRAVLLTGNQHINGNKHFYDETYFNGIGIPYTFGFDSTYVADSAAYIGFGHGGQSEDYIGYKKNRFYFKDSPGGADITDPDVIIGGNLGIGINEPTDKLDVKGNINISGDYKYSAPKTGYYHVGCSEFIARNNDIGSWSLHGDQEYGSFSGITGSWRAFATVHLPNGSKVSEVRVYYVDCSTNNMTVYFRKTSSSGISRIDLGSVTSTETDSPNAPIARQMAIPLNETINNQNYRYTVIFESAQNNNNHRLYNVRIKYTISEL